MEEFAQHQLGVRGERSVIERAVHQRHPAIAGALVQSKRVMPHPQSRVTARFLVTRRSAEAADQKLPQPKLGARQVVFRIHRPKHIVLGHLGVERRHQSGEAVFADPRIHICFRKPGLRHQTII